GRCPLIVSDTLVVGFIDALRGVPSPYGQLSEAAPPRLETTEGSEAQTAETGTGPSYGVGAVHRHRRPARVHGGPRAYGVRRHLHRAPSTVLATVAPRHLERHRRCPGVRGDAGIPHVSQGTLHRIPIGSDLRACDGSKPFRGSGLRGKPSTVSRNPRHDIEPAAASRNASPASNAVQGIGPGVNS